MSAINSYDAESKLPLYFQIKQQIRGKIDGGHWKPNQEIPPERELIDIFKVSRITIRRALEELVSEGFIYRQRGKGTFVAQKKLEHDLLGDFSFYKQMVRNGINPTSKEINCDLTTANSYIQECLQLPSGALVHNIERIGFANGEPLMLVYAYIPETLCPKIKVEKMADLVILEYLKEEHKIYCDKSKTYIEPKIASKYEAKMLEIEVGSPMLAFEHMIYAENVSRDYPVLYQKKIIRGDRCKLFFQFKNVL